MNRQDIHRQAAEHLKVNDPLLAPVIDRFGLATIEPHTNYYPELVDAIISQQLSVKAAATIVSRFKDLFGSDWPTPEQILERDIEEFRSVGLSRAKAGYVQDLAAHVLDGSVSFDKLDSQSNDEITKELTAVKGIGEWTAHMFLLFCMGRTDVLAWGDLGVRSAIRKLYGFENLPTPDEVREVAATHGWHPYESIACWYLWKSLDNVPA